MTSRLFPGQRAGYNAPVHHEVARGRGVQQDHRWLQRRRQSRVKHQHLLLWVDAWTCIQHRAGNRQPRRSVPYHRFHADVAHVQFNDLGKRLSIFNDLQANPYPAFSTTPLAGS